MIGKKVKFIASGRQFPDSKGKMLEGTIVDKYSGLTIVRQPVPSSKGGHMNLNQHIPADFYLIEMEDHNLVDVLCSKVISLAYKTIPPRLIEVEILSPKAKERPIPNPKFKRFTGKDGQFYFSLLAKNGQVILSSEGYKAASSCMNGIESVRKNSQVDERFDRKETKTGEFYFNLKAANGEVIGKSEMYTTKAAMENGVESVKKNAPEAYYEEV